MSVFSLKLIAVITMIIDHIAYRLTIDSAAPAMVCAVMRFAGRFAFPTFCFLMVNGFVHSRDRKKYLTRLTLFALLSQIPFSLAFASNVTESTFRLCMDWYIIIPAAILASAAWFFYVRRDITMLLPAAALLIGPVYLSVGSVLLLGPKMNVFYTLTLGFGLMCALDRLGNKELSAAAKYVPIAALLLVLVAVGELIDYRSWGVFLLVALWLGRDSKYFQSITLLLWAIAQFPPGTTLKYFLPSAMAAGLVLLYNGRLGRKMQTAFYLVYPVHLALIGLAALII